MNPSKKRQIILIDNRFQLRMAFTFIALQVALTSLFSFGMYMFMDSEVHADLMSAHASYLSMSKMLLPLVTVLSLFSIALSIILVIIFVIIVSHKIAGPMYRFRTVLETLTQRRFPQYMKIRPDDQLGELANSIDSAVGQVKNDMTMLQQSTERLKQCHIAGDKGGVATEIALIESTVNAWQIDDQSSHSVTKTAVK
jgi:methyl-accepting chemotaxis protein